MGTDEDTLDAAAATRRDVRDRILAMEDAPDPAERMAAVRQSLGLPSGGSWRSSEGSDRPEGSDSAAPSHALARLRAMLVELRPLICTGEPARRTVARAPGFLRYLGRLGRLALSPFLLHHTAADERLLTLVYAMVQTLESGMAQDRRRFERIEGELADLARRVEALEGGDVPRP